MRQTQYNADSKELAVALMCGPVKFAKEVHCQKHRDVGSTVHTEIISMHGFRLDVADEISPINGKCDRTLMCIIQFLFFFCMLYISFLILLF